MMTHQKNRLDVPNKKKLTLDDPSQRKLGRMLEIGRITGLCVTYLPTHILQGCNVAFHFEFIECDRVLFCCCCRFRALRRASNKVFPAKNVV